MRRVVGSGFLASALVGLQIERAVVAPHQAVFEKPFVDGSELAYVERFVIDLRAGGIGGGVEGGQVHEGTHHVPLANGMRIEEGVGRIVGVEESAVVRRHVEVGIALVDGAHERLQVVPEVGVAGAQGVAVGERFLGAGGQAREAVALVAVVLQRQKGARFGTGGGRAGAA